MRRTRNIAVLAVVAAFALLFGGMPLAASAEDDPPLEYSISGAVTFEGAPVEGVLVRANINFPYGLFEATTGPDGTYVLPVTGPGAYWLSIVLADAPCPCRPVSEQIVLSEASPGATSDIALLAEATGTASLSGTITGGSGGPGIEGMQVNLNIPIDDSYQYSRSVYTSAGGHYAFTDLPAGIRSSSLMLFPFGNTYFQKSVQVRLVEGAAVVRDTFLTPKPVGSGGVSGTISTVSGTLPDYISVSVYKAGLHSPIKNEGLMDFGPPASTRPYTLTGLPDGTYRVEAWMSGSPAATAAVTVSDGATVGGIDLVFHPYASGAGGIAGVFRDGRTGSAVPGVSIYLNPQDPSLSQWDTDETDETGAFSFAALPDGAYYLSTYPADSTLPAGSVAWSFDDFEALGRLVTIDDGEVVDDVVLTAPSLVAGSSVLEGRVRDAATYLPISGARVTASRLNSGFQAGETTTDASGRFQFTDLPEGTYDVGVDLEGYRGAYVSVGVEGATTAVVIPVPPLPAWEASGPEVGELEVHVVDESGAPIDDVWLNLSSPLGPPDLFVEAFPNGDGRALYEGLALTTWTVTAWGMAPDGAPWLFPTIPVELTESDPTASIELAAVEPSLVSGTVELAGISAASTMVVLVGDDGEMRAYSFVNSDGTFTIDDVRPGAYRLQLAGGLGVTSGPVSGGGLPDVYTSTLWWSEDVDGGSLDEDDATTIEVEAGTFALGYEFTATPGATVRASVKVASETGPLALAPTRCAQIVAYLEVGGAWVAQTGNLDNGFGCGAEPVVQRGLNPGTYKFEIVDGLTGSNAFTSIFNGGARSLAEADGIELDAGEVLDLGLLVAEVLPPDEADLDAIDLDFLLSNGVDVSAYEGQIATEGDLEEGEDAEVEVGSDLAGQWVNVSLNSTPTVVGDAWHQVAADGTVTVTLPEGISGEHRLAVADATGQLVGWTAVEIAEGAASGGSGGTGGTTGGSTTTPKPAAKPSGTLDAPIAVPTVTPTASPTPAPVATEESGAAPVEEQEPTTSDAPAGDSGWILWVALGGLVVLVGGAAALIFIRRAA